MFIKHTVVILLGLTILLLAGCGSNLQSETTQNVSHESPASGDDLIFIGFVQVGAESDWRMANTKSMQETFTQEKGYKFEIVDAQQETTKQIRAIRDFIQRGVDYIVLAPNTETGWDTVLSEAKDAGIPVVIVDRMIDTTNESLYAAWVGSDFLQEGRDGVAALEKILADKGITDDDTVNMVTLQGTIGSSAQIGRTQGFEEGCAKHANWNMLDKQSGEFTQERGQEVMESMLKSFDDIDVVISENDNMTFGAIAAIEKAGQTCGPDGDIIIINWDGGKQAFQYMADGKVNVIVECNPLHGPLVEDIIKKLEKGEQVNKKTYVSEQTFWPDQAEELLPTRF
jgi:simple sugar transport system substrate-binding protein